MTRISSILSALFRAWGDLLWSGAVFQGTSDIREASNFLSTRGETGRDGTGGRLQWSPTTTKVRQTRKRRSNKELSWSTHSRTISHPQSVRLLPDSVLTSHPDPAPWRPAVLYSSGWRGQARRGLQQLQQRLRAFISSRRLLYSAFSSCPLCFSVAVTDSVFPRAVLRDADESITSVGLASLGLCSGSWLSGVGSRQSGTTQRQTFGLYSLFLQLPLRLVPPSLFVSSALSWRQASAAPREAGYKILRRNCTPRERGIFYRPTVRTPLLCKKKKNSVRGGTKQKFSQRLLPPFLGKKDDTE